MDIVMHGRMEGGVEMLVISAVLLSKGAAHRGCQLLGSLSIRSL